VAAFRLRLTQTAHDQLQHFPPEVKRALRLSIRTLISDPTAGKPLKRELEGLWSQHCGRYRIIYQPADRRMLTILYIAVRKTVYEEISGCLPER